MQYFFALTHRSDQHHKATAAEFYSHYPERCASLHPTRDYGYTARTKQSPDDIHILQLLLSLYECLHHEGRFQGAPLLNPRLLGSA